MSSTKCAVELTSSTTSKNTLHSPLSYQVVSSMNAVASSVPCYSSLQTTVRSSPTSASTYTCSGFNIPCTLTSSRTNVSDMKQSVSAMGSSAVKTAVGVAFIRAPLTYVSWSTLSSPLSSSVWNEAVSSSFSRVSELSMSHPTSQAVQVSYVGAVKTSFGTVSTVSSSSCLSGTFTSANSLPVLESCVSEVESGFCSQSTAASAVTSSLSSAKCSVQLTSSTISRDTLHSPLSCQTVSSVNVEKSSVQSRGFLETTAVCSAESSVPCTSSVSVSSRVTESVVIAIKSAVNSTSAVCSPSVRDVAVGKLSRPYVMTA